MVCQQLVLTAFRYPNLSEATNGPDKGKNIPPLPGLEPQAIQFPVNKTEYFSYKNGSGMTCIKAFKKGLQINGFALLVISCDLKQLFTYTTEESKNKAVYTVCVAMWSLVMYSNYFEWNHLASVKVVCIKTA